MKKINQLYRGHQKSKHQVKKIAGRYPTEAILEMKAGDTLSVNKGGCTKTETYMVVQARNELFLVKKKR